MLTARHTILSGLRLVLRPVARLCMRQGISARECLELLRETFLAVAEEELRSGGHQVNMSRLAALTGLQRKEISRRSEKKVTLDDSTLTKVVGQWQSNPRFSTKSAAPRPLSYEGAESEFASLVKSVSSDLNPYTLLFELERSKRIVKRDGLAHLQSSVVAFESPEDFARACKIVEQDWNDMFRAVEENLKGDRSTPHLHLRTEFDNVTLEAMPKICEWLLDRGTTFHEEARAFIAKFDKDANPRLHKKEGGGRVSVGAYSYASAVATRQEFKVSQSRADAHIKRSQTPRKRGAKGK